MGKNTIIILSNNFVTPITHCMVFHFSCPYTSSQNGQLEQKICSINNILRTILTCSSIPLNFWHHGLTHATYLLNILPTKTLSIDNPTNHIYQWQPSFTHLRVFGCLCYPLFPSSNIQKLHDRSTPYVFLGYPSTHRGCIYYDLSTGKIILSRHIIFDETIYPFKNIHDTPTKTWCNVFRSLPICLVPITIYTNY